jgi:histidine triad (HIT) family protein
MTRKPTPDREGNGPARVRTGEADDTASASTGSTPDRVLLRKGMPMTDCVFCEIVAGRSPATVVAEWPEAIAIVPLGPVVDGHVLVIPREHVRDALQDRDITAMTMYRAAEFALRYPSSNIITSVGAAATQSVWHLHVHVVPRAFGDQLMVPWGTLHGENPQDPHRCKGMVALEGQLAQANVTIRAAVSR